MIPVENEISMLSGFYSGLSGLALPIPKYLFPEPHRNSSRLTYYASLFNSVEINSTFYKLPMQKTVSKWAGEVPENFRFTFKLWKEITHVPGINFKGPMCRRSSTQLQVLRIRKAACSFSFLPVPAASTSASWICF